MKQYIIRRNNQFIINKAILKEEANRSDIHNALYAAVYSEFAGANRNKDYKHMTGLERFNEVNKFAEKWLKERGLD